MTPSWGRWTGSWPGCHRAPPRWCWPGPPGAGKTTLLQAGLEKAASLGYTTLRTAPSHSDMRLAFAGLADLLGPRLDAVLAGLPAPQRHALGVALLVEEAPSVPPEPRVIAAAFRTALLLLAASAPVLLVIDDVQWLDAPTAAAAGFALRRLAGEQVGLLCAQRVEAGPPAGPPLELDRARLDTEVLSLGGLSVGALHHLLRTRLDMSFSHPTLRRIEAESAGNPFIALEIGRALARRGITRLASGPLPVPVTLAGLVGERLTSCRRRCSARWRRSRSCPARRWTGTSRPPWPATAWTPRSPPASWTPTPGGCASPTRCWPRRCWPRSAGPAPRAARLRRGQCGRSRAAGTSPGAGRRRPVGADRGRAR